MYLLAIVLALVFAVAHRANDDSRTVRLCRPCSLHRLWHCLVPGGQFTNKGVQESSWCAETQASLSSATSLSDALAAANALLLALKHEANDEICAVRLCRH